MKVAVLGSGMVGSAIAMDLASRHHVTAFDVSNANLELLKKRNPRIETQQADLRNFSSYPQLLSSFDIVVTAVPGFMGYKTLEASINCKTSSGKKEMSTIFFPQLIAASSVLYPINPGTAVTTILNEESN